jgi:DNA (cytosine-5)-methyltransferase 1
LEAEWYEVQPYVLPAVSVNAPHRRDRVWFVAYSNLHGCNQRNCNDEINPSEGRLNAFGDINESNGNGDAADTCSSRLQTDNTMRKPERQVNSSRINGKDDATDTIIKGLQGCTDSREVSSEERTLGREGDKSSTEFASINKQSNATDTNGLGLRRQSDGSGESRFIGKNEQRNNWQNFTTVSPICNGDDGISDQLDSITFPKWRNESIKAGGNAIVPQVVLQIFKTIEQYENLY